MLPSCLTVTVSEGVLGDHVKDTCWTPLVFDPLATSVRSPDGGGGVPPSSKRLYSKRFGEPDPALVTLSGVELLTIALATSAAVADSSESRYSAATPATCGLAIDVPLIVPTAAFDGSTLT